MFSRFRSALGLTLLLTLFTSIAVFAKGSFAFITISGPDLKEPIRSSNPALTEDFFAFANFIGSTVKAPTEPGIGYEITRYYKDGGRESAFDRLHYYPETGYVYFDGLVNGSSEYDGKWYQAQPGIKPIFLGVLPSVQAVITEPQVFVPQPQSVDSNAQFRQVTPPARLRSIALVVGIAVLMAIATFVYWHRRTLVS